MKPKLQKLPKKVPKSNILKKWLGRCTIGMSSPTLQKPPAILQCIVTEIWTGQNSNFKSGFLPKLQNFCKNLNLNFLLHNFGKYIICPKSFKFLHVKKDNFRNQNCKKMLQNYQNLTFWKKKIPKLNNKNVFANTTKKLRRF